MNPIVRLYKSVKTQKDRFYKKWIRKKFRQIGEGVEINRIENLSHPECISIGDRVYVGNHSVLEAITKSRDQVFHPEITIGDGTRLGDYCHLGAVEFIHIGKNVLTGRFVLVNDHSHGSTEDLGSDTAPFERPLVCKGGITIGDNVWLGDKVTVLSGVTIGEGSIIGANSVVTKDVPAHSFAAGCPAKVIKTVE